MATGEVPLGIFQEIGLILAEPENEGAYPKLHTKFVRQGNLK